MEKEIKIRNFPNVRTVYISTEIDEDSVLTFKKDLNALIATDEEVYRDNIRNLGEIDKSLAEAYKKNVKFPEIIVDITSPGGSVYCGLAMYDIIRQLNDEGRHTLIANVSGYVASAATYVMLGCDIREAAANTSFCIHSISSWCQGKLEDIRDDIAEAERLLNIVTKLYTERTNLSEEKLKEIDKLKKDWWIGAKDALEFGLVTSIK